jgi:hypothetical protein
MKIMIMKTVILFCCLCFLAFNRVNATESQDTTNVTIHLKPLLLDSTLVQLEKQSGLSFVGRAKLVDPFLPEVDTTESQDRTSITIYLNNLPFDSALVQLERQSGHSFIYQDKITGTSSHVNQEFEDKPLSHILDTLFAQTENGYAIIGGKQVIIYKMKTCADKTTRDQPIVPFLIEGKVIDEKGKRVWGACVAIKKERRVFLKDRDYKPYVSTKVNGTFVISVDNPDAELIVFCDMYYAQVVHIKDSALITLKARKLDIENEIIITGERAKSPPSK